jgi:hypothetical protein
MTDDMNPFPENLSDEAAFALSETLHWLAMTCEEKYFIQLRRHAATFNQSKCIDPDHPWIRKPSAE